ncbi:MAG TPA: hypothetical protein VJX67_13885 [Blastocatellia bacterium]|nr:hypothetical protein [Blastocatellia bacterium]
MTGPRSTFTGPDLDLRSDLIEIVAKTEDGTPDKIGNKTNKTGDRIADKIAILLQPIGRVSEREPRFGAAAGSRSRRCRGVVLGDPRRAARNVEEVRRVETLQDEIARGGGIPGTDPIRRPSPRGVRIDGIEI